MPLSTQNPPSHNRLPDEELVARAQEGDQMAFDILYRRYNDRIYAYVSRMVGDYDIGSELTQETFLKAWERLLDLREAAHFVSWLYRIATNIVLGYQRKERKYRWLPWEDYQRKEEYKKRDVMGLETHIEEQEILKQALARIPFHYRACLILYIIEDLPQKEVAERLAIKESIVSKYVARGKEELRQIYFQLVSEQNISEEKRGK